ncbi:nicotinamide mononucleotide transporter [bacterium]|nr:nicotinamide mononucleotide transporter [bacterium]
MKVIDFIKAEIYSLTKFERILFPSSILFILLISLYKGDSKLALISAICGISYTILAGKGKIYCYFIGLAGSLCYSYLAFKNTFYAQVLLYSCYFIPMQILGIFVWKKHLKEKTLEIKKTCLNNKQRFILTSLLTAVTIITAVILKAVGDLNPYMDSFASVFSVAGQYLTLKRCIEQWYIWFFVNLITLIMWIQAYYRGSDTIALIIMWSVYLILAVYFLIRWKKELKVC